MKRVIYILLAIGVFLLTGCGPRGPKLATSAEDIVGTWQQVGGTPRYLQFFEDGTLHVADSLFLLDDQPFVEVEFRFEGTQLIMEETFPLTFCQENPTSIFEVHLLENGNLQFVAVEDKCGGASAALVGVSAVVEITREWEPVP